MYWRGGRSEGYGHLATYDASPREILGQASSSSQVASPGRAVGVYRGQLGSARHPLATRSSGSCNSGYGQDLSGRAHKDCLQPPHNPYAGQPPFWLLLKLTRPSTAFGPTLSTRRGDAIYYISKHPNVTHSATATKSFDTARLTGLWQQLVLQLSDCGQSLTLFMKLQYSSSSLQTLPLAHDT